NDLRTFPCSCSRKKRGGGVASSPTAAKLVLLFSQTGIRPSPCSLPHGNAVRPASLHAGEARRSGLIRITHALHALHRLRAEEQVEVGRHLDGLTLPLGLAQFRHRGDAEAAILVWPIGRVGDQ